MENVIYWQGPGWYYPASQKDDNGNWFTVWSYWTPGRPDQQPEPLQGLGTPNFFSAPPEDAVIRMDEQYFKKLVRRVRDALNKTADASIILKAAELFGVKL